MKKMLTLSLVILIFAISVHAVEVPRSSSVNFGMEFTRSGRSVLSFIKEEPTSIPIPENEVIEKADPVSFGEITSSEDLAGQDSLDTSVALYWEAYGNSYSLQLSFVDSTGFMLQHTINPDQGYNYQVEVTSDRIENFEGKKLFEGNVPTNPIEANKIISLASNSPVNGHTYGSVTLDLSLPIPEDRVFITGQYTGLIKVNMVVED